MKNLHTTTKNTYQALTQAPKPTTAHFIQGSNHLRAIYTQHDFGPHPDPNARLPITRLHTREFDLEKGYTSQALPTDERLIFELHQGACTLKFRKAGSGAVAEVWQSDYGLEKTFDLSKVEGVPYGLPLACEWFGGGDLSPDGKKAVFVASRKYGEGIGTSHWAGNGLENKELSNRYQYQQDWGESYTKRAIAPQVLLLDLETGKLETHGDGAATYGQVLFVSNEEVVCTRWSQKVKLGIVYCHQRRSELVLFNLKNKEERLLTVDSKLDFSCRSPILIPESRELIYLSREAVGAHFTAARLRRMPIDKVHEARTIVDIVQSPKAFNDFPGIYLTRLPKHCILNKTELFLSSQWGLSIAALKVDIDTGKIQRLSADNNSTTILGTNGIDKAVAIIGVINRLPRLAIYHQARDEWEELRTSKHPTHQLLGKVTYQCLTHENNSFESLLLLPDKADKKQLPLVIYPHGGPHSAFHHGLMIGPMMLAQAGFGVICCNFRGSTGYGEELLNSLPGRIGTNDVADCLTAIDDVLAMGIGDENRLAVVGGSHGGYLSCLLTSLPHCCHRFRATVMRNPVTDLSTMIGTSDIEDWVAFEAGIGKILPKNEAVLSAGGLGNGLIDLHTREALTLWDMSPMRHAVNVTAATLVDLGEEDARVPPSQGLAWVRKLRQLGKARVECYVYPDNGHPLSAPFADADVWVNAVLFLREELG